MVASHPYRAPDLGSAPKERERDHALRVAQSLTKLFLLGWSSLRVGVCSARGLDAEGCAALLVVVAMTASLVSTWNRLS